MRYLELFAQGISRINQWVGETVAWLIIPLTVIVAIEVGGRYLFGKPTMWAWDVNVQLAAAIGVLGGGYVLFRGGHAAIDSIVGRLSPRARARIDLVTSLFFFAALGLFVWKTAVEAGASLLSRQVMGTYFNPPIYPLKVAVALGFTLLVLQGIAKFVNDLRVAGLARGKGER